MAMMATATLCVDAHVFVVARQFGTLLCSLAAIRCHWVSSNLSSVVPRSGLCRRQWQFGCGACEQVLRLKTISIPLRRYVSAFRAGVCAVLAQTLRTLAFPPFKFDS
ncbi:hypothetical protein Poly41_33400 [Novipirellula artificiosorum]|uniref:Uncharacterized protein n=1 Tax=Novipirellula artificiosorum TaxID=2528016 RepID=A0A5C6DKU2_9BACT|nr:hypothetical protein Poly41_33400 [Novipirellula artificiosorum]